MEEEARAALRAALEDEQAFLALVASDREPAAEMPWVKVAVRPVLVRGRRRLQFSYFDGKQDLTQNYLRAAAPLDQLLSLPFCQWHLQSRAGDLQVRVRRGRTVLRRAPPSRSGEPDLAHDRQKRQPLSLQAPDPFLQAIGIMDQAGKVSASLQAKAHQVNEFLRLLAQVLPAPPAGAPLGIVDCGCGSAYLTFAAYHYLHYQQGLPVWVAGVDANEQVIAKCRRLCRELGWQGLEFHRAQILAYSPPAPPAVVLSLHACDTATDEALAQGVRWGSELMLAAPCCQHELRPQLRSALFRPLLRHGILKQRTADLLTDAFRALLLRIMGYRTDVVEFVSPEHTSKNLLIRARRGLPPGNRALAREYRELRDFWGVQPGLERLLGEQVRPLLDEG